jgi:hypothetical protein
VGAAVDSTSDERSRAQAAWNRRLAVSWRRFSAFGYFGTLC